MTTIASLRSICLNDLYRHEDLWELAVEGDIHGVVSVLQMSVPWMPNRRKKSWEKWEDAPLLALSGKWYQFWEKGLYSLVSSLLRRQSKHFGLVFWAITSAMRLSNSSFQLARSESVFKVYLLLVVMQTKQRLLNRHLCSGTHPRYSSAWIKSAVIVQWWWIYCRWIHNCPYNQWTSCLIPQIHWFCIRRAIRVGVRFHLPLLIVSAYLACCSTSCRVWLV